MNKECIDKTGPIYCCICPLSKRQSVTWVGSLLTDGPTLPSSTAQVSLSASVWLMVLGLVASSQWLATH